MARKIFISYKYADADVAPLNLGLLDFEPTTARRYVDVLQSNLSIFDHINKGEKDDEDLSDFKDSTIRSKLRDKIFDSSITIVLITKGMKSSFQKESEQWIPWEISYSLRESTRGFKTSRPNAILAVVIPDRMGSYDYFIQNGSCIQCNCRILRTDTLFEVLRKNMFNQKLPELSNCDSNVHTGQSVYLGEPSYIKVVKWNDFIADIDGNLDLALKLRDNIDSYNITKTVTTSDSMASMNLFGR
ncbi:hypothetical protein F7Q91_03295 [Vibrio chagasii]|uniref:Thoeris protein ThsB TIR-like domain-containing protein n=1 Tax=Vibrio chagasii TaxID=170679 RepID=A0A7V7NWY3_9VIBR|nr:TIR domain-containing protein [Vibrio chagasii]KAB0482447.1 hypothetical protein F7Q91_03295 [Vibrio chagasii]